MDWMSVDWSVAAPGVSAAATAVSSVAALASWRQARRSQRSADVSARKADIDFGLSLLGVRPAVYLEIDRVEYRWVAPMGRGMAERRVPTEAMTLDELIEAEIFGEVEMRGHLRNGDVPLLLTVRDHPHSLRDSWRPSENESVFRLGGPRHEPQHRALLDAGATVKFVWTDRRSAVEWIGLRSLHGRNLYGDPELVLPRLRLGDCLRQPHKMLDPAWRMHMRCVQIARSGFELVAESRGADRLITVWRAEVVRTPMSSAGRVGDTLAWTCQKPDTGPVDDDQVIYRYRFDNTLARLQPASARFLPGRA
ncbi:hypothetical protein Back2_00680 [Nocardioides baekrokdamisoli]|uniref:Uncharacterized protein n=1 Tax=Nocardioides baekrokdamisoli TaxID=1804624 RepID=A0A3G9IQ92_9ACTN|nr:hypothetical protein Back2_00680 [Nocardioides baekrokdamisoli]